MNNFEATIDQLKALDNINTWFKELKSQHMTMGGFAGTGKTTLLGHLRKEWYKEDKNINVAFCAFTGKATQVMKRSLEQKEALFKKDSVSTIHSLIYSPIIDDKKRISGWNRKEKIEADLIVIDEASMVNQKIWRDLLDFRIPILAVGDHGQLPPIEGSFNLMENPIIKLEKIHRQSEDNPIIKLSMLARNEGKIPIGKFGNGIRKINKFDSDTGYEIEEVLQNYKDNLLILAGYNKTRINLNKAIRNYLGHENIDPEVGDKVICLKNNWQKNIFNGMTGKILSINGIYMDHIDVDLEMENGMSFEGKLKRDQFNNQNPIDNKKLEKEIDYFDFGYALTVHKAQGSQANKVLLFEERFPQMSETDWRRWLYTGITRAEKELLIVGY